MLTNPVFHTWFGNRELQTRTDEIVAHDEIAHDQLTQILVQFGFAGLSGFLSVLVGALWFTHRGALAQRDLESRKTAIAPIDGPGGGPFIEGCRSGVIWAYFP